MAAWQTLVLALLALAAFAGHADAHAGHLHLYPATPDGEHFIRTNVAYCTSFAPLPQGTSTGLQVAGSAVLQQYLYNNCSNSQSSTVDVSFKVTKAGKPAAGVVTSGYAQTGSCATVAKAKLGGQKFMFNATLGDANATNMLWWRTEALPANGSLHGSAANAGTPRFGADGIHSFVIYQNTGPVATPMHTPLACCDFSKIMPPPAGGYAAWYNGKGKKC